MQRLTKIFILFLILAIPVLIYLFLQAFGENKFALPVFYEEGVQSEFWSCDFPDGQHLIPDFSFTNQEGEIIAAEMFDGKITIANFIFTRCPSICPVMTNEMKRIQDAFENNDNIRLLSFSVDPVADSVPILKEYAERNEVKSGFWHLLTGEKTDIYQVARCGYILPVDDGDGGIEDFIHSERLVLVDPQRRIRGYYNGVQREEVDRLITELQILQKEYEFK